MMATKTSLGEIVYDKLKQDILSGKFAPKDKLNENAIASMYRVSRTPVREALQKLAKEGLVIKKEDGYYVSYLTKEEILKLYDVILALEVHAITKILQAKALDKVKELEEIVNKLDEIKDKEDKIQEFVELANKFHLILTKMSNNEFLYEFIEQALARLTVTRVATVAVSERRLNVLEELKRVLNSIKLSDVEKAKQDIMNHLNGIIEYIKKTIIIV
jgi:DNA-binding GntR family transcriptional regulator